jgi:diguanylate cyclase (GGDEF)-like protein/PAS domain S-box-containing protein
VQRVFIRVWLTALAFLGLVGGILWLLVWPNFVRLEQQYAALDLERAHEALRNEQRALEKQILEWSQWDDAYAFVQDHNRAYIERNFSGYLATVNLSAIAFADNQMKLVFGQMTDPKTGREEPLSGGLGRFFQDHAPFHFTDPEGSQSSLIRTAEGLFMVAVAPVLKSDRQGPPKGLVMMARRMDPALARHIGTSMGFATAFEGPSADHSNDPKFENTPKQIHLHRPLLDFKGNKVAVLAIELPRPIHQWGLRVITNILWSIAILTLVVALLMNRLVRQILQAQGEQLRLKQRYQAALEQSTEAIFLLHPSSLEVLESNLKAQQLLGYQAETLRGQKLLDLLAEPPQNVMKWVGRLQSSSQSLEVGETLALSREGHTIEVELSARLVGHEQASFFLVVLRDIRSRKASEAAVQAQENRLQQITNAISDVVALTDASGRFVYVTPSVRTMLGHDPGELLGRHPLEFVHPDEQEEARRKAKELLLQPGTVRYTTRYRKASGEYVWAESIHNNLFDPKGRFSGAVIAIREIDEQIKYQAQIEHMAYHDALTGLPNRRMLQEEGERYLAMAERKGRPLAVLLLDLDRFKRINDTLGHDVGDMLLAQAAERLTKCLRAGDILARLGGDEFAFILSDTTPGQAAVTAERILSAIGEPMTLLEHELRVQGSIGIACYPQHGNTLRDLLKSADIAMYQGKKAGGGLAFYDPIKSPYKQGWLGLEAQLQQAIEREELTLFFQPLLNLKTGLLEACEGLIRWPKPEGGLVAAGDFVPVAEESGLIVQLDQLSFKLGFAQLEAWAQSPQAYRLSLNLSAHSLQRGETYRYISQLLRSSGIAPGQLVIEITETATIHNPTATREALLGLKSLGVKLAVDDFGNGYASLGYLRQLPVDYLKIDRSLVGQIGQIEQDQKLVQSIIALGHALGLEVVAEGVETHEQLDWLQRQGCDFAQGYLIGKPMPAEKLPDAKRVLQES